MFQFRRFPSYTYGFSIWYLIFNQVDCSIRKSADQNLLAIPRSFSQLTTSFFGSWCQGIHPALLLAWPLCLVLLFELCSSFEKFILKLFPQHFIVVEYFQCFPHLHYFLISLFNFQGTSLWRKLFIFFMVGTSGLEPPTSRLSGVRSNHLSYAPISSGGDEEDRTPDPLRARQVLSQLSYTPVW